MQNWYELMLRCVISQWDAINCQNCLPDMAQLRKTLVPQLRNFCNSFAGKQTRLCASSFLRFQLATFAGHKFAILQTKSCLMFLWQHVSVWALVWSCFFARGAIEEFDLFRVFLLLSDQYRSIHLLLDWTGGHGGRYGGGGCILLSREGKLSEGMGMWILFTQDFYLSVPKASQLLPFASTPKRTLRACAPS